MTAEEEGCDLFVDAADQDALLAMLGAHLGVPTAYSHLSPPGFAVRVGRNRLADGRNTHEFLDWPTLVEVSAEPGQDLATFMAEIIGVLRAAGHRVVAVE